MSRKQRILYIINPISGTQRKQGIEQLAREGTDAEKFDVEIAYTERAGHATELAQKAVAAGFDVVVAVGGDGTVNEVGRALVGTPTALAIIPCGSGNGLARHLQIPLDAARAIEVINQQVVHELDYGTINDHPFFCTCGVGFDAFISERFANSDRRGFLTYVENTLAAGLKYRPQTYVIEDETGHASYKAFLIACANASQYGNDAYIAPFASMKDGLLDVVVMEPFNAFQSAAVALQLFTGRLAENDHVQVFRTQSLRIHRQGEGVAHYDGDPFVTSSTIDVKIHQGTFRVVVNPDKKRGDDGSVRKNLLQLIPHYFYEWSMAPVNWTKRADRDLRRLNQTLFRRRSSKDDDE